MREKRCTLMDDERRAEAVVEYNKNPVGSPLAAINSTDRQYYVPYLRAQSPEAPTGDVKSIDLYPFGSKDANDITVSCSSLNGYWNERLHLRRRDGQWHQALSVLGPTVAQFQHPFVYYDPDFPEGKMISEKDWKPISNEGKKR